jgi:hypothetical protein
VGSGDGVSVGGGSVACTMAGAWVTVAAVILGGGSGEVSGSGWMTAVSVVAVAVTKATSAVDCVAGAGAAPQAGNNSRAHSIKKVTVLISKQIPLIVDVFTKSV